MGVACLSLGSNVDAEANLRAAVAALRARFGGIALSDACVFPAVGFDGGDFLNAAAVIDTSLAGAAAIGPRFGDRTLDIDIVFYDDLVLDGPGHLQLPRDELKHAFVLMPLAEIAPGFVDPRSGKTLEALWRAHREYGAVRERIDIG